MKISNTGVIHGYGSARFKWISGLTKDERDYARSGGIVLVEIPYDMRQKCRARWKKVTVYRSRFGHQNYYDAVSDGM